MKTPPELVQSIGACVKDLNGKLKAYHETTLQSHGDLCDLNEAVQRNFYSIRHSIETIKINIKLDVLGLTDLSQLAIVYRMIRKDLQDFRTKAVPSDVLVNNLVLMNSTGQAIDQMIDEINVTVAKKCN